MDYEEAYNKYTTLADIILGNTRVSADAIQSYPQPTKSKGLASRATEKAKSSTEKVVDAIMPEKEEDDTTAKTLAEYISAIRESGKDIAGNPLIGNLPSTAITSGGPRKFGTSEPSSTGLWLMQQIQKDYGVSVEDAAAIVGNFAQESGNFTLLQERDPKVKGSRGGYGYAQWTGPRRVEFENFAKANGLDITSRDTNYANFKREMEQPYYRRGLDVLKNGATLEEKTHLFGGEYLRPSEEHANYNARTSYAEAYLRAYPDYISKRG